MAKGKLIMFSSDAREKLKKGFDTVAKAVITTLGPKGRNVAISSSYGAPTVTKDGVTVANAVSLADPLEAMGAELIKMASSKTNDVAGDGTTTATVLAQAIANYGLKNVAAGANPISLKRGIDKALDKVVEYIESNSKKLTSDDEISQVATISANNDSKMGEMIAGIFKEIGIKGVVTVDEAKGYFDEVEYTQGMKFDRGYVSPYFVTNTQTLEAVMDNPYIFVTDMKLSSVQDIQAIAEKVLQAADRPLLIIADDVDGQALTTLVVNKLRGVLNVVAVKAPGFGDRRKEMLKDIAVLTGATYVSEEIGRKLDSVTVDDLGSAAKIIVDKENTLIIDGKGSKEAIDERVNEITAIMEKTTSDYDKEKLQERLAKLSGGVAVLRVGAATEVEMKEKKDRVQDAINATRAAIEKGIVPGGGLALYNARKAISEMSLDDTDENTGVRILESALSMPLKQIAENAGFDGAVVASNCSESKGFNAKTGDYVDMFEAGIIDPSFVVVSALKNAASAAGMLMTTEAIIADMPETESHAGHNHGDMGMDGMM